MYPVWVKGEYGKKSTRNGIIHGKYRPITMNFIFSGAEYVCYIHASQA